MSFNLEEVIVQKGKIAIVTGANIGLGFETTRGLAAKGIKVIMACRNLEKAEQAKQDILAELPDAELDIIRLDLGSLQSVREFAKEFNNQYDRLDLLIENAGIMIPPLSMTEDGFESQIGVNYLAHFLLTNLLFPTLRKTKNGRIVTLSSNAHKQGKIDFDNFNAEKEYSKLGAYSQSKLACLMFAYELQRRIEKAQLDMIAVSAHPGVSMTNLGQHIPKIFLFLLKPLVPFVTHSADNAALPTLNAALSNSVNGGDYYGPTGRNEMKGKPGKVTSIPESHNEEVAEKLWAYSEELTGSQFVI